MTLLAAVRGALMQAAKFNGGMQTPPVAVLWTDAERQWAGQIQGLKSHGVTVLTLGAFDPADRKSVV